MLSISFQQKANYHEHVCLPIRSCTQSDVALQGTAEHPDVHHMSAPLVCDYIGKPSGMCTGEHDEYVVQMDCCSHMSSEGLHFTHSMCSQASLSSHQNTTTKVSLATSQPASRQVLRHV